VDEKVFEKAQARIMDELKDFMSPELINRIDHKIVFKPLSKEVLTSIFKKNLKDFLNSWKENSKAKVLEYNDKKIKKIIDEIYDPQYGARPVERYIHDKTFIEKLNKALEWEYASSIQYVQHASLIT
jgi:ATP-dependent Clp protease ATP-binding subunit ClpB